MSLYGAVNIATSEKIYWRAAAGQNRGVFGIPVVWHSAFREFVIAVGSAFGAFDTFGIPAPTLTA